MRRTLLSNMALAAVVMAALSPLPAQGVDKTWNLGESGSAANPAYWTPYGVPGPSDKAILPNIGQYYTVTSDAPWHIDDLEIGRFATGWVNGYNLTVNRGGDIYGTLYVQNATYTATTSLILKSGTGYGGTLYLANGTLSGNVNTSANSQILGYGTITENLDGDVGLVRAENGVLNISLANNDHDDGILSAATGGTLHITNTANITNRATIDIQGGTLWGYQYYSYNLINYESGCVISGRGTIDRYYVQNNYGAVIAPSGGTLTLAKGFASTYNSGTINLAAGATLNVGEAAWTNYGMINMTGGAITGQTLNQVQSHTLSVTSGSTNSIQNVSFSAPYGAAISNGATLSITGTGTLIGSTIRALSGGGKFSVSQGAQVQGRGTVEPDMDVAGTLKANSSGNTLTTSGALTVLATGTAKAESGGILALAGNVRNLGLLQATGGTVTATGTIIAASDATGDFSASSGGQMNLSGATLQTGVRNTFTAYTGGTVTLPGGLSTANLYVTTALRPRGGTIDVPNGTSLVNASGKIISGYGYMLDTGRSLANRGTVDASGGTLELRGTILADASNTGTFSATGGTLRVVATLESGLYNTFTANASGTVRFPADLNTSLFAGGGLSPLGGTITLEASDATLTNAPGKTIAGYGQLLETGRNLANQGTVQAAGGTLTVPAAVTNSNVLTSAAGATLALTGTLVNNGQVYVSGGTVTIADTAPTGSGTFTAQFGGSILFRNGFTNAYLSTVDALQLAGGTIALNETGTMTNETGKTICGYGTLLAGGQSLTNRGLLEAVGDLVIAGSITNQGNTLRADSAGDSITVFGNLTTTGLVEIGPGAKLVASNVAVEGGAITGGQLSLNEATMTVHSLLTVTASGHLYDNETASDISVYGSIDNRSLAAGEFELAHSKLSVFNPFELGGPPHRIVWQAKDRGAELIGFDHNMAVGTLTLGNGHGAPKSDMFEIFGETTIYCYGLQILEDAHLDLGGRTLYYLHEGIEYNGIVGTGLVLEGTYENGQIVEVVPEPATLTLLALGGLVLLRRRSGR